MKQFLIAFLFLLLVNCSKEKDEQGQPEEKGTTKTASVVIKGRLEYSDPQFNNLAAYIRITVKKHQRSNQGQFNLLWDTIINERPARLYPYQVNEAITISREFKAIVDSIEIIKLAYSINYIRDNQALSSFGRVHVFDTGNKAMTIPIRI